MIKTYTMLSYTYNCIISTVFFLDLDALFSCTSLYLRLCCKLQECELGIEIGVEDINISRFYIVIVIKEKFN